MLNFVTNTFWSCSFSIPSYHPSCPLPSFLLFLFFFSFHSFIYPIFFYITYIWYTYHTHTRISISLYIYRYTHKEIVYPNRAKRTAQFREIENFQLTSQTYLYTTSINSILFNESDNICAAAQDLPVCHCIGYMLSPSKFKNTVFFYKCILIMVFPLPTYLRPSSTSLVGVKDWTSLTECMLSMALFFLVESLHI